ncbi:TPA: LamG domain-containing protein [Candidatus Poribacteria bacterium]|nr:LamG domain-containing protein [Candidatus Poribacteria bacterium]
MYRIAKDLSQYDNHGALVGGPKWVKGKFNGALELDGVDDYVVVEKSDSLKFGKGSFSVEAWVNLSTKQTTGGPGGRLANDRGTGAGGTLHGWQIKINNTGDGNKKWGFNDSGIDDATGNYGVYNPGWKVTTANYGNGEWYHVGVVYKAGTGLSFYVNAELDGEVEIKKYGSLDNDLPVVIGAAIAHDGKEGQLSQFFPGIVDEIRIWNRALSQNELETYMTEGLAVYPSGKLTTTWGIIKIR